MKIEKLFEKTKRPLISFEIFPPNEKFPIGEIYDTIDKLVKFKPDFISVTYGAGGTARSRTVEIASRIKNRYNIPAVAHLTCIGAKKSEIYKIIKHIRGNGIRNILALRGDVPKDCLEEDALAQGDFEHASDLIEFISEKGGNFSVGGAFYPEGHCENNDLQDLLHLKYKVDIGAKFLISQIFFDNAMFIKYREQMKKLSINVPIIAGIMPVTNEKQIRRICAMCHSTIPPKLQLLLDAFNTSPQALEDAGVAYAVDQIIDLIAAGVDGIHIYTMNKPHITAEIMRRIEHIRYVEKRG